MKCDIILSGVGGQGILSIAAVIGEAVRAEGLYIKQAEVHGMSQRGGDVQTNLRISSTPIASDLIPVGGADAIISLEPMEALRYLPYLKKDGWVVTSSKCFVNIPNYPAEEDLFSEIDRSVENLLMTDVEELARGASASRSANIALLGIASQILEIGAEDLLSGIERIFARKGEAIVEMNKSAFKAGVEFAKSELER